MASKIKVDQIETVDGTGSITVNQPLSGSGAGLTSLPAANITGVIPAANLGTGTASSTTFLNGSGAYSEAGGGAWTVITSTSISSAVTTVNFTTGISSTYDYYMLVGSHVIQSGAGGTSIKLSSDAGSSWHAGTLYSFTSRRYGAASPAGAVTAGTSGFDITPSIEPGPATGMPNNWTAEFWNLSQATSPKSFHSKMICTRSGTIGDTYGSNIWGNLNVNTAMNGIQVVSDGGGGNFVSGRITLYGIKHA
jgi:hypothetical protein